MAKACRTCGVALEPKPWQVAKSDYECAKCKRARQNAYNAKRDLAAYSRERHRQPHVRAYLSSYHKARKADPEYTLKRKARRKVYTEIEAGRLSPMPCEVCGSERSEAHHRDYTQPLDVRWLCRRHHLSEEHRVDAYS